MGHSMRAGKEPMGGALRLIAIAMFLAVIGGGVVACSTPSLEPWSALVLPPSGPATEQRLMPLALADGVALRLMPL